MADDERRATVSVSDAEIAYVLEELRYGAATFADKVAVCTACFHPIAKDEFHDCRFGNSFTPDFTIRPTTETPVTIVERIIATNRDDTPYDVALQIMSALERAGYVTR